MWRRPAPQRGTARIECAGGVWPRGRPGRAESPSGSSVGRTRGQALAEQAHIGSYGRTERSGSDSGPTALNSVGGQWVDRAAQIGLVARGVVYVVFGIIAFDIATGDHSGKPSSQGALTEMAQQPYGTWLLGIVALGLFAYAVACALGAIRGRGGKKAGESDTKDRVMDAGRAVINASLAVYAVKILMDGRSSSGSGNTESK